MILKMEMLAIKLLGIMHFTDDLIDFNDLDICNVVKLTNLNKY